VHLLVVDAYHGAHPWPAHSQKERLRLAEQLAPDGSLTESGADALVKACVAARKAAAELEVDELMAFATSAVRSAGNSSEVLRRVHDEAGIDLRVLSGEDEARMTFLAVRRWFGWSAGRLLVLDIGGGSLEIAEGIDEDPTLAMSFPLGAGRLTRDWFTADPPSPSEMDALEAHVDSVLEVGNLDFDLAAATSKTFRSLARLAGAATRGPRAFTRCAASSSACPRRPWQSSRGSASAGHTSSSPAPSWPNAPCAGSASMSFTSARGRYAKASSCRVWTLLLDAQDIELGLAAPAGTGNPLDDAGRLGGTLALVVDDRNHLTVIGFVARHEVDVVVGADLDALSHIALRAPRPGYDGVSDKAYCYEGYQEADDRGPEKERFSERHRGDRVAVRRGPRAGHVVELQALEEVP
jgi:exopolyphosphatase / guanosine-5'-triphosphate,3'-diphosphate pyrophosphatase